MPLAAPDDAAPDDLEGLDDMEPAEVFAEQMRQYPAGPGTSSETDQSSTYGGEPPGPLAADPPAGRIPKGKRARGRPGAKPAGPKVTAAVRSDIEGKFGLMLQLGGSAWAARDPVCGGQFLAQLPAIRPAAVDLILLSPDLVMWFAGVGGGFMLWFNLLAACWPVLGTVWAHHGPGAGEEQEQAQAGAQAYAAL